MFYMVKENMEAKKLDLSKIKKIEFAGSTKLAKFPVEMAPDFIKRIFGIKSFMISDESTLSDFMNVFDRSEKEEKKIVKKIIKYYGVDITRIKKPWYLWKIFKWIL